MKIGATIRNMGIESTAEVILQCARAAEAHDMESVWITDHIAIPPDDAEGSGGRWLDGRGISCLGCRSTATWRVNGRRAAVFYDCFAADELSLNGQAFLFKPRPPKPPVLVGGAPPHALRRAAELGDGWLPMAREPGQISSAVAQYRQLTESLGKPRGDVTVLTALPLADAQTARAMLKAYREMGVDRLVCAIRYADTPGYKEQLDRLQTCAA